MDRESLNRINMLNLQYEDGDEPGLGDDIPCSNCGAIALDTGLECSECGYDMRPEIYPEDYEEKIEL